MSLILTVDGTSCPTTGGDPVTVDGHRRGRSPKHHSLANFLCVDHQAYRSAAMVARLHPWIETFADMPGLHRQHCTPSASGSHDPLPPPPCIGPGTRTAMTVGTWFRVCSRPGPKMLLFDLFIRSETFQVKLVTDLLRQDLHAFIQRDAGRVGDAHHTFEVRRHPGRIYHRFWT
jgi:hypothetical protein